MNLIVVGIALMLGIAYWRHVVSVIAAVLIVLVTFGILFIIAVASGTSLTEPLTAEASSARLASRACPMSSTASTVTVT